MFRVSDFECAHCILHKNQDDPALSLQKSRPSGAPKVLIPKPPPPQSAFDAEQEAKSRSAFISVFRSAMALGLSEQVELIQRMLLTNPSLRPELEHSLRGSETLSELANDGGKDAPAYNPDAIDYRCLPEETDTQATTQLKTSSQYVPPAFDSNLVENSVSGENGTVALSKDGNGIALPAGINGGSSSSTSNPTGTEGGLSIVQFSTVRYYCCEAAKEASVDIIRLGDCGKKSSVQYNTFSDYSQFNAKTFVYSEGSVVFDPGESLKQITLPVMDDEIFDTTLEFQVKLKNPQGADLGQYLDSCFVTVIDDDAFPTNKYREDLQGQNCDEIPAVSLMTEYFRMNYSEPIVRQGTLKSLMVDQLHNLAFVINVALGKYIVDDVLTEQNLMFPNDPILTLLVVVLLTFIPLFVLHFLEYKKCFWKVGGSSRRRLQVNLLRKFLNYDESSRAMVSAAHLVMSLTRDAPELVAHGYMQLLNIVRLCGRLALVILYQCIFSDAPLTILPLVVFPLFMAVFLKLNYARTSKVYNRTAESQTELVKQVDQMVSKFRLIADYHCSSRFLLGFDNAVALCNKHLVQQSTCVVNNNQCALWLRGLLVGFYIIYGGSSVLRGTTSIGDYFTTFILLDDVGLGFVEIYKHLIIIQAVLPSLYRLTRLMNLTVDVEPRMWFNGECRIKGERYRQLEREAALVAHLSGEPADRVRIFCKDLTYGYSHASTPHLDPGLMNCSVQIKQGSLVAVVGPHGQGKSTFLRLVGNVMLPQGGLVFIPPWLRVLHVSAEPVFFQGSLMSNLTTGLDKQDTSHDASQARIIHICQNLHLGDRVVSQVKAVDDEKNWDETLSRTQKHLLSLARALIANPHILVIHHPTLGLDNHVADQALSQLRHFVDNKGLEQDPTKMNARRPRTCVFSTSRKDGLAIADQVICVYENKAGVASKSKMLDPKTRTMNFTDCLL